MRALIRDFPDRAFAIVTSTHALVFRHAPSSSDSNAHGSLQSASNRRDSSEQQTVPRCMVEWCGLSNVDLSDFRPVTPVAIRGTIGAISLHNDIFIGIVTGSSHVATLRPGETVQRIHAVEFHCLTSSDYDLNVVRDDVFGEQYGHAVHRREPLLSHPCVDIQKLLGSGSFYYSTDFDITNRLQDR